VKVTARGLNLVFEQETPSGTVDGTNATFTLTAEPHDTKQAMVYLNGGIQRRTSDWSISGTTLTFVQAPALGQTVYVTYYRRN